MQVYLAVPSNADTSTLRSVLQRRGVEPYEYLDFADEESVPSAGTALANFWDDIDAVIAVPQLRGGADSDESVLIDIGVAIGRGMPVIVLTEDEELTLELAKWPLITVRAGLDAEDALDLHLSLFLAAARQPLYQASYRVSRNPSHFSVKEARRELDQIQALTGAAAHMALEAWVESLLRSLQVSVAPTKGSDRGFDFVYSPLNPQYFPGPIVVEVKGKVPYSSIEKSGSRLQSLVIRERAALGLLLFLDVEEQRRTVPVLPGVVIMGMYELLDALASKRLLDDILWQARNKTVHKL